MDRLTRNAMLISTLLLVLLIISLAWNRDLAPRIWQLNTLLEQDPVLANYPYDFKAVLFVNGIVTLTSPHASVAPLEPFLRVVDVNAKTSQELEAARARFEQQERHVIALMLAEPDVESVEWSLDRAWYHRHHLPLAQP
ncbi:hypothetical protein CKO09_07995 [Chromatium weissei]|nr:hypothetical protein [Chromatium weissei]